MQNFSKNSNLPESSPASESTYVYSYGAITDSRQLNESPYDIPSSYAPQSDKFSQ